MTNQPEAQEFFFIVEKLGDGRHHGYEVMSTSEVEDDPSVQLVSGHFNTRAEAEADLSQGLKDGSY
jgi:hypothetical protein